MKTYIISVALLTLSISLTQLSCTRKSAEPDPTPVQSNKLATDNEDLQVQGTNDQNNASNQIDAAMNDAGNAIAGAGGGRIDEAFASCSPYKAVSTTVDGMLKTMTINYDGTVCNGRQRWGTIVVTLTKGSRFSEAGAQWSASFTGYRMGRIRMDGSLDSAIIELNGSHQVTNLSGGLVRPVMALNPSTLVIHDVTSSDMSLTFPDGTKRSWNVNRRMTWDNSYTLTISGLGNSTYSDAVTWGTNRFGDAFVTRITTPIVKKLECNYFPNQGERVHEVTSTQSGKKLTVTETILSNNTTQCAGGFSITFSGFDGRTRTRRMNW